MPKGLKALYLTPEGPRGAKGPSLFLSCAPLWGRKTQTVMCHVFDSEGQRRRAYIAKRPPVSLRRLPLSGTQSRTKDSEGPLAHNCLKGFAQYMPSFLA